MYTATILDTSHARDTRMLCGIGQRLNDVFAEETLALKAHVDAYKDAVKDSAYGTELARLETEQLSAGRIFKDHQRSCPVCGGHVV